MMSVTNPSGPTRLGAQRCSSTPITRTPTSRSGPAAAIGSVIVRIAIVLTACQDTPNSAAMAEMVGGQSATAATHTGHNAGSYRIAAPPTCPGPG
jgi:hypothetical protein